MWRSWFAALALMLLPTAADPQSGSPPVTFNNQIVRLLQDNCQACHRPGDIGPFPLITYQDAHGQQDKILGVVESRKMPPWKPVPGFGDFVAPRRLSAQQIDIVRAWVESGAPEGDARDLPPPRQFPDMWTLGQPDAVLAPAESFEVPSGDRDLYRCFVIPTSFAEDRYLSAVEYLPGNRKVVHHVLTFLDTTGQAEALDRADPGPGYTCFGGAGFLPQGSIGGWAPGSLPTVMREGVGMLLPAGARVVMQVHYHNQTGVTHEDRSRIALHFATKPVDKRYRSIPVWNRGLTIPAGAERHEVRASWTVPAAWNLHAIGVFPHMHLLGREMTVTATYPDGTTRPLIRIDDWDFHWQGGYDYVQPVPLPGGTRIDVVAIYDNSERNRRNPNKPPKEVSWGEGTSDEMCIAFIRVTVDAERLNYRPPRDEGS
jgi:mono/diheme cytochrome c family protein